ncbi:hypothetical protein LAC81_27105 [Ensifer adhaerens]|uniref:hypothetical protein n=1 Tax=Ensifer adhaerens TaxID=106592 RepID=UPI001CBB070F|nr:hypothetical protein [Ensifer adhaerens]MBZ7924400.1 hypothetical protein [Ensifer adhaerens]UAX96354.1 hypothetical protein LAC78_21380 [Ensifer adhaerens]UAY04303.1 hypothetical protein LAC80_23580 [Ensifer adhaerens]UAY12289.1 hypothetical protein LAC81_27105 [Ensifer adhaerens]
METIIEELLDMAVHKIKKFESVVQLNEGGLQTAGAVLVKAYDMYQENPEVWAEEGEAFIAKHYSDKLRVLCLMFELTVLHAKALASIRLINAGFDPKADERIRLLNATLKFGGSFRDKMRVLPTLTMATEPT